MKFCPIFAYFGILLVIFASVSADLAKVSELDEPKLIKIIPQSRKSAQVTNNLEQDPLVSLLHANIIQGFDKKSQSHDVVTEPAEETLIKIPQTQNNDKSDNLVGYVPVKNSKGDTYLIPKEAIEAVQKQYDAAGLKDGAILIPESIIEINEKENVIEKENKPHLIQIVNKNVRVKDIDEPSNDIDDLPLGRQAGRRRRGGRRGGRRGVRRRGGRRRGGGRRRRGGRRGGRRRRGGGRRRRGGRRGGRRRGGGRKRKRGRRGGKRGVGIHIRRRGRGGNGKRRYILRGCRSCPGRKKNSFRRRGNVAVVHGNGVQRIFAQG